MLQKITKNRYNLVKHRLKKYDHTSITQNCENLYQNIEKNYQKNPILVKPVYKTHYNFLHLADYDKTVVENSINDLIFFKEINKLYDDIKFMIPEYADDLEKCIVNCGLNHPIKLIKQNLLNKILSLGFEIKEFDILTQYLSHFNTLYSDYNNKPQNINYKIYAMIKNGPSLDEKVFLSKIKHCKERCHIFFNAKFSNPKYDDCSSSVFEFNEPYKLILCSGKISDYANFLCFNTVLTHCINKSNQEFILLKTSLKNEIFDDYKIKLLLDCTTLHEYDTFNQKYPTDIYSFHISDYQKE